MPEQQSAASQADTTMPSATIAGCDLFLDGGIVITIDADRRVIADGAIAIRGDRIVAVGDRGDLAGLKEGASRIVDSTGKVIIPGLTDGHTHLFQTLGRGLGDGLSLVPWLRDFMFPYARSMTRDVAVAGVRLGALQAALSGTTMVVDNHYAPTDTETTLAVADAIESVGIRGAVARGIFGETNPGADLMGVDPELFQWTAEQEMAITAECIAELSGGAGRVSVWPAPENIVYITPGLIAASAQMAADSGVHWHMHCSEAAAEVEFFETLHSVRPVAWLESEGLLSDRTTLAHAIWLDADEVDLMGSRAATAVHNPVSNQYLASGVLKLRGLQAAGANVALGSDGIAVAGQDMFEAMKAGTLMHRVADLDSTATTVEQFLELAALGGAAMTGLDGGALVADGLADVVVLNVDTVRHAPWNRPVASIVHSGRSGDVEMVVVGGEVIVEGGASTRIDQEEVIAKAQEATAELFGQANLERLTRDWQTADET